MCAHTCTHADTHTHIEITELLTSERGDSMNSLIITMATWPYKMWAASLIWKHWGFGWVQLGSSHCIFHDLEGRGGLLHILQTFRSLPLQGLHEKAFLNTWANKLGLTRTFQLSQMTQRLFVQLLQEERDSDRFATSKNAALSLSSLHHSSTACSGLCHSVLSGRDGMPLDMTERARRRTIPSYGTYWECTTFSQLLFKSCSTAANNCKSSNTLQNITARSVVGQLSLCVSWCASAAYNGFSNMLVQ